MISYKSALAAVLSETPALGAEYISIEESKDRVLDENIHSGFALPSSHKSKMDGYAVRVKEIKKVPVVLKCSGLVRAGKVFKGKVSAGECVKIMTGADLPAGLDSVVPVENAAEEAGRVTILIKPSAGEYLRRPGEDIKKGALLFRKGRVIKTADIALLAAIGRSSVSVIRRPGVTIVNTGEEIVEAGKKLPKNKIYNSDGPLLFGLLLELGIKARKMGTVRDNIRLLRTRLRRALDTDILLVTGGVSAGEFDFVAEALRELGVKKIFHKVRIKPGKPLFFGKKARTLVFGIPGNPVSGFIAFQFFIKPAILRMQGVKNPGPEFKCGIVREDYYKKKDRLHFVLAKIAGNEIYPVPGNGSADLAALSESNGCFVAGALEERIKKGSKVKYKLW